MNPQSPKLKKPPDPLRIPSLDEVSKAKDQQERDQLLLTRWGVAPIHFVEEAMGISPTEQQKEYFIELGKLFRAKVKLSNKWDMTEEEVKYSKMFGISIMSAKGPGKSSVASMTMVWFLMLPVDTLLICTGPDATTLRNVLWKEASKWINNKKPDGSYACVGAIRNELVVQTDKIYRKQPNKKDDGKFSFAESRTAKQKEGQQASTIRGRHNKYMITMIEEASEVPEENIDALITSMTQEINFSIMIFNPTRTKGYAIDTQTGDISKSWISLQWNAEDSPLVSPESIQHIIDRYGKKSNQYRIDVLGFPPLADVNTLITYDWITNSKILIINHEAVARYPMILGVDCAGMGADKYVIVPRRGGQVYKSRGFGKVDSIEGAGFILTAIRELEADEVCIDEIGYGWGAYNQVFKWVDRVRRCNVHGVNTSRSPVDQKYNLMRDELWWKVRDVFENGLISVPRDEKELFAQLSDVKYTTKLGGSRGDGKSAGRIKIESKAEMKRRLGHSPDHADALVLTYYVDDAFMIEDNALLAEKWSGQRLKNKPERNERSWMEV